MADAKITLTLSPGEFDIVREALRSERNRAREVSKDRHTDLSIRQQERERDARLTLVIDRWQ